MSEKIKLGPWQQSIDFILNRLLLVFFFACVIVYTSREISDLDLWLHLKTGHFIIHTGSVPLWDIFSFTLENKSWINHEWFFQVISFLFYTNGGANGLIIMQNIVVCITFMLLLSIGLRRENHVFVFFVFVLTLLAIAYRFTVRPDIFSFFFLTLYLVFIKFYVDFKSPAIWLLPLCQIVWTNMHGFSFFGPVIVLLYLATDTLKKILPLPLPWKQEGIMDRSQKKKLWIVFWCVCLSLLVNPYVLKGALYPFVVAQHLSGKGEIVFKYIQELARPISFKNILDFRSFLYYKVFIIMLIFSFRYNRKRVNLTELILAFAFLGLSLIAIRNIAYFIIVGAVLILNNLNRGYEDEDNCPFPIPTRRWFWFVKWFVILSLVFYVGKGAKKYLYGATFNFETYKLKSILWDFSQDRYPEKAVDFLVDHKFPDRMFNDFNSGAYLIGRAFPSRKVFIDGRTELYGTEFFTHYIDIADGKKEAIETMIARYDIQGFFLTHAKTTLHTRLYRYLFKHPLWQTVYFDDKAVIFLKDTPRNSVLIKKFGINLKEWVPPKVEYLELGLVFRFPLPFIERARFLNRIKCYKAAEKEARVALSIMPNNAEALRYISDAYFEQKEYLEAFTYARAAYLQVPGNISLKCRMAELYQLLGDDNRANKGIEVLLQQNSKNAYCFYVKARMEKNKNNLSEAVIAAKKAVELDKNEPEFHEYLGDLLYDIGEVDAAKKEWVLALGYNGADEDLLEKLKI